MAAKDKKEKTDEVQFNLRVPRELKERLEKIAPKNIRSLNGETIFRLHNSFSTSQENLQHGIKAIEELLLSMKPTPRRVIVQQRLEECLKQINATGFNMTPERLARDMGEQYAEPTVNIFCGIQEPSFTQLEKIATHLNINPNWLLYGENGIFNVKHIRLPHSAKSSAEWLLNQDSDSNGIIEIDVTDAAKKTPSNLYFIRNDSEFGELIIIKQYQNWYCTIFTTPYEIIDWTNESQGANLAGLLSTWKLLYQTNNDILIQSYIISQDSFATLAAGNEHPLSILKTYNPKPWWEDIWDIKDYKGKDYWSGWNSLCERINRMISSR